MGQFVLTTYTDKDSHQKRLSLQFLLAADEYDALTADAEFIGVFISNGFDISSDKIFACDGEKNRRAAVTDEVVQDEGDSTIFLDLGALFKKYASAVNIEESENMQMALELDFDVLNEDEKAEERDIHMQLFLAGEAMSYQQFTLHRDALKM